MGGSANFGFVTEITYKPPPLVPLVLLYEIVFEWYDASSILEKWQRTAPHYPGEFNEDLSIFTINDEIATSQQINITGIYVITNGNVEDAQKLIKHETSYLDGTLTMHKVVPYSQAYQRFADARRYHNFSMGGAVFSYQSLKSSVLLKLMEKARRVIGRSYLGLQLLGGAIFQDNDEMSYNPRNAKFFVDVFSFWDSAVDQESNLHWNRSTFETIRSKYGPICYYGFPHNNLPVEAYFGSSTPRLKQIKEQIDPFNLLRYPGSL